MANKKNSKNKQAAGRPAQKTPQSSAEPSQTAREKKKPKGPTRGSGALSVGLAIFGMIWTFTMYMKEGPGWEALFGVFFIFLCLVHATYNFQAVKRQEAIERGEIPDPKKVAEEKAAAEARAKAGSGKKKHRYAVYHVKRKPKRAVKRGGTALR